MSHDADLFDRWNGWLDRLYQHIVELHHDRTIWRELIEMVDSNLEIPDPHFFLDWVSRLWATTTMVGIRRIDDEDEKSVSLVRLIRDVGKHADLVSKVHYRALYEATYPGDTWMQKRANEEFDDLVGAGVESLPPAAAKRDADDVRAAAATIRRHVNKYIAHIDERVGPPSATYSDLDAALEGITAMYRRYSRLIKGYAASDMSPTMQFDWMQPFLVPWKPDPHYLEVLRRQGAVPRSMTPAEGDEG